MAAALSVVRAATISHGGEYYIMSDYYGKVLGPGNDASTPRLSEVGTLGDPIAYIVVAEASGTEGWWLLRNKQTGRYLKASTENTWSLVWAETKGTGNEYLWQLDVRFGSRITSKKSTGNRLGCDWTEDETVPVYYDKPTSSRARWSVFPALEEGFEASLLRAETDEFTNAQGRREKDYWQIADTVTTDQTIDIHLTGDVPFASSNSRLLLSNTDAWVIFDHVSPSTVISTYLRNIRYNNRQSVNGTNVRVAIWLDGAAVIPCRSTDFVFTGYTETGLAGDEVNLRSRNTTTLAKNSNSIRSFVLKRGYMATLASGENGSGYSRVYVADHSDIVVDALPEQLDRRISSVNIRPWQYVGKKGWCSTKETEDITDQMSRLHAGWFYTWSADRETTADAEYVPIRQHIYWPSLSQINGLTASTHVLGFNEPEHSEQHSSDKCSCGGAIDSWKATTYTPDLQESGMRIGSPSPTDAKWLYEYIGHCDDMTYRCDFVAIHAYWGPNEANGASAWYDQLKTIYDKTHRPIWITEWAYGASWTTESWPSGYNDQLEKNRAAIMEIQDMLERCPFVERYSYYQWDTSSRRFINDDGWMTPAGRVYRDTQSNFAYDASMQYIPHWWRPSTKQTTLSGTIDTEQHSITFTMTNPNGDCTDTFVLQCISADGSVKDLYEVTDRSLLENGSLSYTLSLDEVNRETDFFRISSTTLFGGDASSNEFSMAYVKNGRIITSSKSSVDGWTCLRSAANGYTKDSSGNTYLEVWNATPGVMNFDYYQDITDLPAGIYRLSALCFNSTDGVADASVNGSVGLYAQAEGVEYFEPVTTDARIDDVNETTIEHILVRGGTLRIGIKNIAPMTARWAGGDNFVLQYVGSEETVLGSDADSFLNEVASCHDNIVKGFFTELEDGEYDARVLIVNPDCARSDTFGWEASNIEAQSTQPYDTDTSNAYWDKWQSGSLHSSLTQTLRYLPAGDYVLSAMMRAKTDMSFTLSAIHSQDGTDTDYSVAGTGVGDQTQSGSPYKNGWLKLQLPTISIARGAQLTVKASIDASITGWWSVDHFQLLWTPAADPVVDGITEMNAAPSSQTQSDVIYDLQGRRLVNGPLSAGIYLINGQKVFIK